MMSYRAYPVLAIKDIVRLRPRLDDVGFPEKRLDRNLIPGISPSLVDYEFTGWRRAIRSGSHEGAMGPRPGALPTTVERQLLNSGTRL